MLQAKVGRKTRAIALKTIAFLAIELKALEERFHRWVEWLKKLKNPTAVKVTAKV